MEVIISQRNIYRLCRVCLTTSSNLTELASTDPKYNTTHLNLLEKVTGKKVALNHKKLPYNICQMCASFLKIAYDFQVQFENSQKSLEQTTGAVPLVVQEDLTGPQTAVELICGSGKFDLSQILIVEEKQNEEESFQGFLKNLGSEVSVKFANKNDSKPVEVKDSSLIISEVLPVKPPPKPLQKFECPVCHKISPNRFKHFYHKRSHFPPPPPRSYVCEICGFTTTKRNTFSYHQRVHKGTVGGRRFPCDFCGTKFASKTYLKEHMRGHENVRPYLCSVCGKSFVHSISLKYHMWVHTEKTYQCRICDLKTVTAYRLKRHMRTHNNVRPYKCQFCEKTFGVNRSRLDHEALHTGHRPHECKFCNKRYIKKDNLKRHLLSHSGPNYCDYCTETFVDPTSLKKHMKMDHADVLSFSIEEIVE